MNKVQEIIEIKRKLKDLRNDYWFTDVFLTLNWWFLLFLTIVPWLIWWKLVDKNRFVSISIYGCLISI